MKRNYKPKPNGRGEKSNTFKEKLERVEATVKYRLDHPKFLEDGPHILPSGIFRSLGV